MRGRSVRGRIAATIIATALGIAACGGATSGGPGQIAPGGPCPSAPPAANSSCAGDVACEYGTDPDVSCDTVAKCTGGAWTVSAAPGSPCSTALGPSCPATYATLLQGDGSCSADGTSCAYAEARCTCATHCGMLGEQSDFWCCPDGPPTQSGCPSPRPRLGSPCVAGDTICDYGGCQGNVTVKCVAGTWQPTQVACPG